MSKNEYTIASQAFFEALLTRPRGGGGESARAGRDRLFGAGAARTAYGKFCKNIQYTIPVTAVRKMHSFSE